MPQFLDSDVVSEDQQKAAYALMVKATAAYAPLLAADIGKRVKINAPELDTQTEFTLRILALQLLSDNRDQMAAWLADIMNADPFNSQYHYTAFGGCVQSHFQIAKGE